jgi:hypothetical protein
MDGRRSKHFFLIFFQIYLISPFQYDSPFQRIILAMFGPIWLSSFQEKIKMGESYWKGEIK